MCCFFETVNSITIFLFSAYLFHCISSECTSLFNRLALLASYISERVGVVNIASRPVFLNLCRTAARYILFHKTRARS